jgi:hypothetical protein
MRVHECKQPLGAFEYKLGGRDSGCNCSFTRELCKHSTSCTRVGLGGTAHKLKHCGFKLQRQVCDFGRGRLLACKVGGMSEWRGIFIACSLASSPIVLSSTARLGILALVAALEHEG